jgi:hypothetical protein
MARTNRTSLFSRKQPGGVFVIDDMEEHPGNIFFVDSGHAAASDAAGFGRNPDAPCATIDYAVALCTASNGDVIYAMPGHAETVTEAGGLDLDVAGISLIGLGNGGLQPTVTFTTIDTADVDIDAANVTIRNIHFVAGVADLAAAIDVNADDFTIEYCRFTGDNAGLNALIWIQDALATASDRITVRGCYCNDRDASNTHFINFAGTGDGHIIEDNVLLGDFGTICIGGAGVVTNVAILNNYISNAATTADSGINVSDTSTGIVANNRIGIALAADATTGVDCIACAQIENYVVDTGDRQGILDPVAT